MRILTLWALIHAHTLCALTHAHRCTVIQLTNDQWSISTYEHLSTYPHSHLRAQSRPPWTCLPGPPAGWPPPSGRPRRSSRPMRAFRALPPRRRPLGSAHRAASAGHSCAGHSLHQVVTNYTVLHCKEPMPKIGNRYSKKRNCAATVPISTFMWLWAIYIFLRTICLFFLQEICGPILGIYKSFTDTWIWKLGLRPRNSQKRNT